MSDYSTTRPVESSETVIQRLQASGFPGTGKHQSMAQSSTSTPSTSPALMATKHEDSSAKRTGPNGLTNTQRLWTSFVAGAIAGALAKTTIAPLDRTKINFQISKQLYSARAAIEFLINTVKKEGLLSLWRGNSATMVRIVPYSAVQFTAHEQWKRVLNVQGREATKKNFLAGALAGVTSQGVTYPLDLMRARMAVTQRTEYKTLRQVCQRIYVEEGFLAYYRGFTATLLGVIPYAGCSFFTYDILRSYLVEHPVAIPGFSTSLICGGIAGAVGQTASYPLDIIRRRIQTSAVKGTDYRTIGSTLVKILREEGMMAFFKGLSMNWVKGPIAVGISYATHDWVRETLRKSVADNETSRI